MIRRCNQIYASTSSNHLEDSVTIEAAIAGAGPSGLLLAHYLLSQNQQQQQQQQQSKVIKYKVTLFESRSDPRLLSNNSLDERAYALGIGIRGRSAIQNVATSLWETVKQRGFLSDKFQMYFNPTTKITLRDDQKDNQWKSESDRIQEPSLLIYQTDLCSALLDELYQKYPKDDFEIYFNSKIATVNLKQSYVTLQQKDISVDQAMTLGPYDIICGCDGVNSKVRDAMVEASQGLIQVEKRGLPGIYKVARMDHMPPTLEPNAVALIMPSSSPSLSDDKSSKPPSTTLFVEPVIKGGACVLFAGRDNTDPLLGLKRQEERFLDSDTAPLVLDVLQRFPLLNTTSTKVDIPSVVTQLLSQNPSSASSIWCNIYSFLDKAVLCGDAAHCTGGVSGQGVNSALVDTMVLAQCLQKRISTLSQYNIEGKRSAINQALLDYSMRQVPEGHALYEMSVGALPLTESVSVSQIDEIVLTFKKIFRGINTALDTVFGGRFGIGQQPIQTRFTTSMESFASIRRGRELYFDQSFKSDEYYQKELKDLTESIHKKFSTI